MLPYPEILARAQSGEPVSRADWEYQHVTLGVRLAVDKFQLNWNKTDILPQDDALVDRIFQAGWELALGLGIYHAGTGRVIRFSPEELAAGLRSVPQTLVIGEGGDERLLFARQPRDSRPPLVWGGSPGTPIPEEIFYPLALSYVREPLIDLLTCGSLVSTDGMAVQAGEATEILATRQELSLLRRIIKDAGRPGMGMLAAQSSLTELGDLAVSQPDYLRPCDAHLVPLLNELILDGHNAARVVNSLDYGMRNASLACVMLGGLAGGAGGAAALQVASIILANLVCRADYHILHPVHIRRVATSDRGILWMQSAVLQAFARNAPCIIVADVYPKSGAQTPELLWETAACALVLSASGGHLEGAGAADGAKAHCSGLEARWMAEIGRAASLGGLGLEAAASLGVELVKKYEHIFNPGQACPGVPFDQCYDLETITPRPEWQKMYEDAHREVEGLGLRL